MKKKVHHILCYILMLFAILGLTVVLPDQEARAAEKTAKAEPDYFNVTTKYLYLGIKGRDTFDMNLHKSIQMEVVDHYWYVIEEKGNPKAVEIDTETGIVKAKNAGIAYIGCEITLTNKKVVTPEAEIIVINNITGIGIKNVPKDNMLYAGQAYDFNEELLATTAGGKAKTSGITRWEVKDDTAGVEKASDTGVVLPKKAGSFSIRAVSFEKEQDFDRWLGNKEARKDKITAASEWVTITVILSEGEASTQEQLISLLSDKSIRRIILTEDAPAGLLIPKGDYPKIDLIVRAQQTSITNQASFQRISFESAYDIKWTENGKNNHFELNDSVVHFDIGKNAQVKSITFEETDTEPPYMGIINQYDYRKETSLLHTFTPDAVLTSANLAQISVSGKIDQIELRSTSSLYLSGGGKIDRVILADTAKGSRLAAAIPTKIEANADCIVSLMNGAEAIEIIIATGVATEIENLTMSPVGVYYGRSSFMYTSSGYKYSIPFVNQTSEPNGIAVASSVVKLSPSRPMNVTASSIKYGQMLWFSNLHGDFIYNTMIIPGSLSWVQPDMKPNSGYFMWKFTPTDSDHFAILYGYAEVKAE